MSHCMKPIYIFLNQFKFLDKYLICYKYTIRYLQRFIVNSFIKNNVLTSTLIGTKSDSPLLLLIFEYYSEFNVF